MQQHARDSTVNVQTPNQPARDASLAFRPASVTPGRASAPNSVSSRAGLSRVEGHRPRGGRGGRVRGGPAGIYSAGGRAFGGNLTSDQASTASGAGPQNGLQGDAPTFTPGQQMVPRRCVAPDIFTQLTLTCKAFRMLFTQSKDECQNHRLQILPQGHTRISPMDFTNALSVRARS